MTGRREGKESHGTTGVGEVLLLLLGSRAGGGPSYYLDQVWNGVNVRVAATSATLRGVMIRSMMIANVTYASWPALSLRRDRINPSAVVQGGGRS